MRREPRADAHTGETQRNRAVDQPPEQQMNPQNRTDGEQRGDRGVSEVIGAILIFGLVLALLALVQVSAVPAANEQIEYEHSQRVEGDFQQLDNAIDRAAFDGTRSTTPLELGTRYPVRLFLLNPGPVSGDIQSTDAQVRVSGFDAVNDETDDYLQGTLAPFETQSIAYRADYNEYRSAPRIGFETGVLYERYAEDAGGRDLLVDRGALVSGRRITVLTLDARLSTQQVDELSLDAVPVSTSTRPVSVAASGGASITVETSLSEATWKTEVLDTEFDPDGTRPNAYVSGIECTVPGYSDDTVPCDGELVISFEPGTYDLRMAKVGLGSGFAEEGPRYLTTVSGDGSAITDDQTQQLTVEVRDRYNNPVSGVNVSFSGSGGGLSAGTVTSDEGGQASVVFSPSNVNNPTQRTVEATIAGGGQERRVEFSVTVSPDDGGDGSGEPDRLQDINPRTEDLELQSATLDGSDTLVVTFRNTADGDRQIRAGRIPFVLATGEPDAATLTDGTTTFGQLLVTDELRDLGPITVPAEGTSTVRFEFDDILEQSGGSGNFDAFFVFTATITDTAGANDQTQTFFISDELGVDPFTSAAAGDVRRNEAAATQTFSFTPRYDMAAGQTVTVDLDSAQGIVGTQPSPVDYRNASVTQASSTLRGGSATLSAGNDDATLTYTVGTGGLSAGQAVTVQVDGVATQSSSTTVNGVEFTWSFAGSETTSFQVRN